MDTKTNLFFDQFINHSKTHLKLSLILLVFCFSFQYLEAKPITRQQALSNAKSFLEMRGKSLYQNRLRHAPSKSTETSDKEPYYYFNIGNHEGFVIASGDDATPAIFGYSDKGEINTLTIPQNMTDWLEEIKKQIDYANRNGVAPRKEQEPRLCVEPLLTTQWGQGYPYNLKCPEFFDGNKCITGCVATAMAQIMYYHRKKSTNKITKDIPSYDCSTKWEDFGYLHVNGISAGTLIDWNNMMDDYSNGFTEEQVDAVANLMLYCGVSSLMDYSSNESGAQPGDAAKALKEYFDYCEYTKVVYRDDYQGDWDELIYNEIASGNPVLYSGYTHNPNYIGHAFVCDGYDGIGYYHINWGWDGYCDGYFLLDVLNPDISKEYYQFSINDELISLSEEDNMNGYSCYQSAVINAMPKNAIKCLTTNNITLTSSDTIDIKRAYIHVSCQYEVQNKLNEDNTFQSVIGLYDKNWNFIEEVGNIRYNYFSQEEKNTLQSTFTLYNELDNGTYYLTPISKPKYSNNWFKNNGFDTNYITLAIMEDYATLCVGKPEVSGNIIQFADEEVKRICIDNWDYNDDGELSKEEAAIVTSFGSNFTNCAIKSFDELKFFTGLTTINFRDCKDLQSIIIPENVTDLNSAFWGCSSLTSLFIPSRVNNISYTSFWGCGSLISIKVAEDNQTYDSRNNCNAIIKTAEDSLIVGCQTSVIPNNVLIIGDAAFIGKSNITNITIPSNIIKIGKWAFEDCVNLSSITLSEGLISIDNLAFNKCKNLSSVTIPSSVTSIGIRIFEYCNNLQSIKVKKENVIYDSRDDCNALIKTSDNKLLAGCCNTVIPHSVLTIGDYAFCGINVSSMTIPEGVKTIDHDAFYNCNQLNSLEISKTVTDIGKLAFAYCRHLDSIKVSKENPVFDSRDNCHAIIRTADNTLMVASNSTVIPKSVQAIGNGAFHGLKDLLEIDLPYGITSIGDNAFWHCEKLSTITIPKSVTSIGKYAFSLCSNLCSVTIPKSVNSIGDYAFEECDNLSTVILENDNVIPINWKTFTNCENTTLYVPSGTKKKYREAEYWGDFLSIKEYEKNDVNADGNIDISDVVLIVNKILGKSSPLFIAPAADTNYDGLINISDAINIVNSILSK